MHLSYIRTALLAATSAAALSLSGTTLLAQQAQQAQKPATTSNAPDAESQKGLQQSLRSLEQARDKFRSGQQAQMGNARTEAQRALQSVETNLSSLPAARKERVVESLSAAKSSLQSAQPDRGRVGQALDRVIADVKALTQQADASAGIRVEQASPQVNVQQSQPQITVRQPPPQVTVQQAQPEVSVQQAPPRVSVQQAEPTVNVQRAEPEVTVQRQGEPQVTVQRQGEPQVTVQQQGQQSTAGTQAQRTAEPNAQASDASRTQSQAPALDRQQVVGKDIVGSDERSIGEVEDVVVGQNGRVESVLVDVGGFLGIGTRRVAIPVAQVQMQGDRLTTTLTQAQVQELPAHTAKR